MLEIKVYLNSNCKEPVFARRVSFDSGIRFDFNRTLLTMSDLFGEHCIVIFDCAL